jgi:hypothetical protein
VLLPLFPIRKRKRRIPRKKQKPQPNPPKPKRFHPPRKKSDSLLLQTSVFIKNTLSVFLLFISGYS